MKHSLEIVAMKFISKSGRSSKDLRLLQEEMKILHQLDHPHIIRMIESFETPDEIVVVTEFADGELFQVLEDDRVLNLDEVSFKSNISKFVVSNGTSILNFCVTVFFNPTCRKAIDLV